MLRHGIAAGGHAGRRSAWPSHVALLGLFVVACGVCQRSPPRSKTIIRRQSRTINKPAEVRKADIPAAALYAMVAAHQKLTTDGDTDEPADLAFSRHCESFNTFLQCDSAQVPNPYVLYTLPFKSPSFMVHPSISNPNISNLCRSATSKRLQDWFTASSLVPVYKYTHMCAAGVCICPCSMHPTPACTEVAHPQH